MTDKISKRVSIEGTLFFVIKTAGADLQSVPFARLPYVAFALYPPAPFKGGFPCRSLVEENNTELAGES